MGVGELFKQKHLRSKKTFFHIKVTMDTLSYEQKKKMEKWKGKYLMTSWENYADFLEKLGVPLLLRKLATMGTPIVEVTYDEETETWNISRTSTIFYTLIKLRSVDFKFKLNEEFDEVTPDKRDVRSIVTVEGDTFKHVSVAKKPELLVTLLSLSSKETLSQGT